MIVADAPDPAGWSIDRERFFQISRPGTIQPCVDFLSVPMQLSVWRINAMQTTLNSGTVFHQRPHNPRLPAVRLAVVAASALVIGLAFAARPTAAAQAMATARDDFGAS